MYYGIFFLLNTGLFFSLMECVRATVLGWPGLWKKKKKKVR